MSFFTFFIKSIVTLTLYQSFMNICSELDTVLILIDSIQSLDSYTLTKGLIFTFSFHPLLFNTFIIESAVF
ncbi:MAG: hypothetical protein Q8S84_07020 [bacterium]|nr:hypothetical protein [bacterium]MDP3381209.1 hypothetical protein [bacterium]